MLDGTPAVKFARSLGQKKVCRVGPQIASVQRSWATLLCFVALTYVLTWEWESISLTSGDVVTTGVGWPTSVPALGGPMLAAIVVTALVQGRTGLRDLWGRAARWRMPLRWWAVTVSPLAFLGVALLVSALADDLPRLSDFGRYSGLPAMGVVAVGVVVILLTFGEEAGWRGFALPILQRRYGALVAALLVTPIWALWHLPFFFTVATYRSFPLLGWVGFVFSLACGSIVLTWLYNSSGGSILACVLWDGLYNLGTGTAAATGTMQAVITTFVYLQAFLLVGLELRAHRRGFASILGPPIGASHSEQLAGPTRATSETSS
jgi:uncharacterized protein